MNVIHSNGEKEIFKPRLIGQSIVKETGIDEELALKIQNRITKKIYKLKEEGLEELQTTQIRAEVSSQLLKEGISEEPYVIIKESDIMNILEDYDKNNANQVRTAGALEYSLFEMVAKRYMNTQYSDEWREAKEYGLVYNHDAAQELYKGLNCFTLDPRFVFKKGLRTYGDNHVGVVSKPPKHFDTALEICEQTLGLATPYIAGGVSIACFNYMLAPFIENLSYESVYQSLQGFMFQMNQSHKNRGCVAGDTDIWVKLDGNVKLMTFKQISDLLGANYGSTDLTDVDLEILTLTDEMNVKWIKPTLFWRNEPRDLYEVILPKGRSFKCDEYHGLISANNINNVRNILDIKKGTQLCDPKGINFFTNIDYDNDYWNGVLYGFWLGDGYKNKKGNNTAITVGKKDKIKFLDLLFSKIDVPVNKTVSKKKVDDKHKIHEYVNYYFPYNCLVSENDNMENKNYLAGLITGMLNSDGSVRIGSSRCLDVSFQNTNEWYIDLLRYALFYFGIRCNKKVKLPKNPNHNTVYRLNMEYNKNSEYLYKQLELRPLFKRSLNKSKPVKFYDNVNRMLVKSVTPLNEKEETFCFTANGRMIIDSGFILTNNSQSMFSSITLDMVCPEFLKNQKAIGPGGIELTKTYGDFDKEARLILDIITNISFNGDGESKPIFFPNLIYNIDNANLRDFENVFDLSAKFSLPYFCSAKNNNVDYQSTLGCRSALPNNWSGDPNIDCMGTGNSVYTTISLPAVALKSKEDNRDFYDVLEEMLYLVHDYNLNRLDWIKKLWYDYHVADFMIQEDDNGVPMYRLEDATIVVGYLGMSECLEILGYGALSKENNDKCQEIMKFMKKHTDQWKRDENLRWGLFQTPCESAAGKLADKMVKRFGFKKSYAKGTSNAPYYTNSNHIAVDNSIDIIERIKLEGANQPLGPAGNIMNLYLGESYAQASALASLCEKIRDYTSAYFFAFTSEFSLCPECFSTFKGNISECPFCHIETDVFSRITGYVTNTKTWNKGKMSEFKERKRY